MDKIIELRKCYCPEILFFVLLDLKYMWVAACAIRKIDINKYASNFFLFWWIVVSLLSRFNISIILYYLNISLLWKKASKL